MPRDLFGDVTRPSVSIGNRKWYTVPVSLLSHSAIVAAAIVIPLLATDTLPAPWQKIGGVIIPVAPTPPQPPPQIKPNELVRPPANHDAAPTVAPDGFTKEKPIETGWEDREFSTGIVDGTADPSVILAPPPPTIVTPPPPVKVGGTVRPPTKVHHVDPEYSPIARAAHAQGVVIIEATIGVDGAVINARVLRPVMVLLDQAALAAVRQWRFTPTLLNGVPVPVIMTVTVNFQLK